MKPFLYIKSGYGGDAPQVRVTLNGETFLIPREHAEEYLLKAILEKGYKTERAPRQQYARLTIND